MSASGEIPLPGLQMATFLTCPLSVERGCTQEGGERERERETEGECKLSDVISDKDTNPAGSGSQPYDFI